MVLIFRLLINISTQFRMSSCGYRLYMTRTNILGHFLSFKHARGTIAIHSFPCVFCVNEKINTSFGQHYIATATAVEQNIFPTKIRTFVGRKHLKNTRLFLLFTNLRVRVIIASLSISLLSIVIMSEGTTGYVLDMLYGGHMRKFTLLNTSRTS